MYDVPSDCTIASTISGRNTASRDLYIKSLEESLAIARKHVATAPEPSSATPLEFERMKVEMDTQRKQFEVLMKQNSDLVAVITKGGTAAPSGTGTASAPCQGRPRARA